MHFGGFVNLCEDCAGFERDEELRVLRKREVQ